RINQTPVCRRSIQPSMRMIGCQFANRLILPTIIGSATTGDVSMPQLLSRRDDAGWLTPAMADILTQPVPSLPSEEVIRAQMANLQQALAARDAPVRIV